MIPRFFFLASLLFVCSIASGFDCDCGQGKMYFKLSPGATFPLKTEVFAPVSVWDAAIQGYDSHLGTRPNMGAAVGCEMGRWGAVETSLTYRGQFKYKKFQTVPPDVHSDLPNKTRRFNMETLSLMGSVYFYGRGYEFFTCECSPGSIYPVIGAGFGISRIPIWDFRSTGLPSQPGNSPLLAFGSENAYSVRWHFAFQLSAGLEYRYCDLFAIGVSYRWYDAGRFSGPRYFRGPSGTTFDAGKDTWKMNLRANEVVVDIKFFCY